MEKNCSHNKFTNHLSLIVLCLAWIVATPGYARECQPWVAKAISIQGVAEQRILSNNQEAWQVVAKDSQFCPQDVLRVRENSRVALLLNNDTIMRLDQNTTITFTNISPDLDSSLDLKTGIAHFISRIKHAFKVITPFVNASVEGTEFIVAANNDQGQVTVFEGKVRVSNDKGELLLSAGQTAIATKDQAPVLNIQVNPRDAVQWALYYPAIIDTDTTKVQLPPELQAQWEQSIAAIGKADIVSALQELDKLPDTVTEPSVYTTRAALRLQVGRVNDAISDINRALTLKPQDSNALALQSIIAVVQNQAANAETLAQQALASDAANPAAHLALSYAKQAQFDLAGAHSALRKAPDTALIASRRAELFLMQGDLDKARDNAKHAAQLNPNLSHTQMVLGFAELVRLDIDDAKTNFTKAIELDPTNPLAHLGLGLTIIHTGDLVQGRREIEYAASLDPNNSLIRSYLGKAYYEEKRDQLAADQYGMAKQLDPNDPTPWLYDAVRKQSENDPIGALQDMQTSIAINDNRAVYRSRFLLDQDNATRNANLGGIYRNLGFEQLAIQKGVETINRDPLNYSAHRLLADTYTTMPRSEFTRVNEYFITQLLQPASQKPITPEQTEMTIGVFKGDDPADLSFNEYSSLLERNGDKLDLNFSIGSNNSSGHSVTFSGIENNTSFSTSHYFYKSDGFRENNQRSQEIFSQKIHSDISQNTSIVFEALNNMTDQGDIELHATGEFNPDLIGNEEINTLRLSLKQNIENNSVFLASMARQFGNYYELAVPEPTILAIDSEVLMDILDVRYFYVQDSYNLSIGGVRRNFHGINTLNFFGTLFPQRFDTHYRNAYTYLNYSVLNNLSVTIGGSYETLDNDYVSEDKNIFNSKLGLSWEPFTATTIRIAYYETLQRPRLSAYSIDPTLEPSQIAGFNQFLFSSILTLNGQEVENRGAAIEHSFSNNMHAGVEIINRDLRTPISVAGETIEPHWTEKLGRLYFYKVINKKATLSAEYILEEFDRGDDSSKLGQSQNSFNLNTQRIPLTFNYSLKKQVNFNFVATHVDQDGDYFVDPNTVNIKENFWIYDFIFNYNLRHSTGALELSVMNITDKNFSYEETNPAIPVIYPERIITAKYKIKFD